MLNESGSDLVMSYIEHLTLCANGHQSYVHDIEAAVSNATLNHLYDLHKLRDIELYNDLCPFIFADKSILFGPTFQNLKEMQDD